MTKAIISQEVLEELEKGEIHYEIERSITITKETGNKENENS